MNLQQTHLLYRAESQFLLHIGTIYEFRVFAIPIILGSGKLLYVAINIKYDNA